jgi:hypothetical protein
VGRCIYCRSEGTGGLGDEHIIPFALNGTLILPQSSCHDCERITSYLDGFIARSVFWHVRTSAKMQSRSGLPRELPVILAFEDGRKEKALVPVAMHPATLVLPKFNVPSLLSGEISDGNFRLTYTTWMRSCAEFDAFLVAKGAKSAEVEASIKPQQFSRALAKIAHSYAVAQLGVSAFTPLLLDLIHQRDVERGPELVGSETDLRPHTSGILHEIGLVAHPRYVVVRIRLFSSSAAGGTVTPAYIVVAGSKNSLIQESACAG